MLFWVSGLGFEFRGFGFGGYGFGFKGLYLDFVDCRLGFGAYGLCILGCGVWDSRVWGFGIFIYGLRFIGLEVWILGFGFWGLRVFGLWFRVEGSRLWYKDLGFKCLGFGFWVFESLKVASKSTQRLR